MSETRIDIECCSAFVEAICPSCLKMQKSVNQIYTREVRDLSISDKKVALERYSVISVLSYREKDKLITYFQSGKRSVS